MIAMALVIGIVLWLAMEKTRMGAAVRATVDDAQMARGVGIDTNQHLDVDLRAGRRSWPRSAA